MFFIKMFDVINSDVRIFVCDKVEIYFFIQMFVWDRNYSYVQKIVYLYDDIFYSIWYNFFGVVGNNVFYLFLNYDVVVIGYSCNIF